MRFLLLLFAALPALLVQAQHVSLPGRQFTIRDGLAQQQVRTFFEDSRGYLWIGTNGGLTRFDGQTLVPYGPAQGFPGRQIYAMLEAPDGTLWYRSGDKVYRFDGQTDSLLPMTPSFWQNQPSRLWPLIANHCSTLLGGAFPELKRMSPQTVLFADTSGAVLFADPVTSILLRLHKGKMTHLLSLPDDDHGQLSAGKQFLWLYGESSCYAWVNNRLEKVAAFDPATNQVRVLHPLAPPVYNYNKGNTPSYWYRVGDVYLPFEPERYNRVEALFQDSQGRLHVATDEGLVVVYPHGPQTIEAPGILYPWAVVPSGKGGVYVSSHTDGVFYVDAIHNTVKKYPLPRLENMEDQLFPGRVAGPEGTFVFGGYKGVYLLKSGRLQLMPFGESVEALAYDRSRSVFLFAGKNLYVVDSSCSKVLMQKKLPDELLSGEPVGDIKTTADGSVWLAGRGGIGLFSPTLERLKRYNLVSEDGMHDVARSLSEDASGALWAGGNFGLYRYDHERNTWRHVLTETVRFPVNALVALPQRRLAAVTDRSVVVFSSDPDFKIQSVYDQHSGYTLLEASENGACFDGKYLWIPAGNGLQRIDVSVESVRAPKPVLRIDQINNRWLPFTLQAWFEGLQQNHTTISMSIVNAPPGGCRLFYRLGNGTWTSFDGQYTTSMNGLSHGANKVQVQLRQYGKVIAETSGVVRTNLSLLQRPGIRWLAAVFLLLLVSMLLYRLWQQRRLKSEVYRTQLRTAQARLNPHVLFNLLSSLQNSIANRSKDVAQRNLLSLSAMMREVLEFSFPQELPSDKPFSTITLAREMDFLKNYLTLEAMQTEPPFKFNLENTIDRPAEEVFLPPMLVQPLVENAVLHGIRPLRDHRGDIRVTFATEGKTLVVQVDDNGVGLNARSDKAGNPLRYRSRGGQLLKERLHLIERLGFPSVLSITPRDGGGTRATIRLENML